jgi:hypothetical protein
MASPISIIINILAFIGVIFIIGIIIYYIYKYYQKKAHNKIISDIFPPGEYMQHTGIKCPDYWVNTGINKDGNYICYNKFNIPVRENNNEKCYDSPNIKTFSPLDKNKTWEYGDPYGMKSYTDKEKSEFVKKDRCGWIRDCGAEPGLNAVWSGVDDICSNPNITDKE